MKYEETVFYGLQYILNKYLKGNYLKFQYKYTCKYKYLNFSSSFAGVLWFKQLQVFLVGMYLCDSEIEMTTPIKWYWLLTSGTILLPFFMTMDY